MTERTERQLTKAEIDANVQKTLAEAEAASAAAAESLAAAKEHVAKAEAVELEKQHQQYIIEHARLEAEIAQIAFAKVEREERFARVSDIFHHVYTFNEVVTDKSVQRCIATLSAWSRDAPGCDITLYISSDGGEITAGFALIDFLLELRRAGHKITTFALGMTASMAAVILQAGDTRIMGKFATLLIHEGSLGVLGSWAEVEDRVALMASLQNRIWELFASRATPINSKTTAAFLKKFAQRKDVWLTSEEARKLGVIDEIR